MGAWVDIQVDELEHKDWNFSRNTEPKYTKNIQIDKSKGIFKIHKIKAQTQRGGRESFQTFTSKNLEEKSEAAERLERELNGWETMMITKIWVYIYRVRTCKDERHYKNQTTRLFLPHPSNSELWKSCVHRMQIYRGDCLFFLKILF